MKSISPIIATILLIVMVVAIGGLTYAFITGMFNGLISSTNSQVNKQTQYVSFNIVNTYCSGNQLYFDIYNNGNVPIDINNSIITINQNGNTIAINGNNVICNNNIITSNSQSICYINNTICAYNSQINNNPQTTINYQGMSNNQNMGIGYGVINNIINITIFNGQNISTPTPFQQDIAICNGNPNINNTITYIDYPPLYAVIDNNGQNVYFTNSSGSILYSWYEGQENINGISCDLWWINIPNGIPANSSYTINMNIGNSNDNYYQQYQNTVGVSAYWYCYEEGYTNMSQCPNYGIYDNGNNVFEFYDNFNGTSLNANKWIIMTNNSFIVDNGLTFTGIKGTGIANTSAVSISSFSAPIVVDLYGEETGTYNWFGIEMLNYYTSGGVLFYNQYPPYNDNGQGISIYNSSVLIANPGGTANIFYFWTATLAPNGVASYYVYSGAIGGPVVISVASGPSFYTSTSGNIYLADYLGTGYVQYMRARAYPPNGVMPSIYIN